jgi:hypothetical protein
VGDEAQVRHRVSLSQGGIVISVFPFEGQAQGDISFGVGEVLLDVITSDDGWWTATRLSDGQRGTFPAAYAQFADGLSGRVNE